VTGAGGCIGAWVVARLQAHGRPVVALDRAPDRRRLSLAMDADAAQDIPWEVADIADADAMTGVIARHRVGAIVHLAALQIPFCAADPYAGARVNVLGHVNVLEAARRSDVRRIVYASSVAAQTVAGRPGPDTLYGIYKQADEGAARVYWQEWQVPSIGLRPHTVYGPGRDQGMTSAPTLAMLAAALGRPYTIPFDAILMMQHVQEVADAFIACIDAPAKGAHVFDLAGSQADTPEIAEAIRDVVPDARIEVGDARLPLPHGQDDSALRRLVGDWPAIPLRQGVRQTIEAFRRLAERGLVDASGI
jgi:nucleoside-diphosphate-sugar epimerase